MINARLAVEGAALHESGEWQQILRLGPVVDIDTGKTVIDITPTLCADLAKAHAKVLAAGLRVPIDYNHGTSLGRTAEQRRTYGLVTEMEARADGLFAKLALNGAGVEWVKTNLGNALVSPSIVGGLFDPMKPGTKLADVYVAALSLTESPRQNNLPEVKLGAGGDADVPAAAPLALLATFDTREDVRRFEDQIRMKGRALLIAEGYDVDEYVSLATWTGSTSGTAVLGWWSEGGGGEHLRRAQWSQGADGVVTVSGPSTPMRMVTQYEPEDTAAMGAASLANSRGHAPEEVPMSGKDGGTQPQTEGGGDFAVLLARLPDADRVAVEGEIRTLTERAKGAEQKADALSVQLAAAQEAADKVSSTLLARVEGLEAAAAARAKADAEKDRAEFLLSATQRGAIGAGKEDQEAWGNTYDALGPDRARALVARLKDGIAGPVANLARAVPGLSGTSAEPDKNRNARISERASALAAEHNGRFDDYWSQAEKEVG